VASCHGSIHGGKFLDLVSGAELEKLLLVLRRKVESAAIITCTATHRTTTDICVEV
jgi:hypothetical protein